MKKLLIISFVLCFIQLGYTQVRTKSDVKGTTTKTQSNATSGAVGVNINLTSILHSLKRKCNQVKIVFPKINSNFKSGVTNPPTFKWKSSKSKFVKSYKVGLAVLNGKEKTMLYQSDTYKTQMAWPKSVAWKSAKKGKTTYQFFVMALMKKGSKCKNVVKSIKFTVVTKIPRAVTSVKNGKDIRKDITITALQKKPSRTGRNPQTGATIKVQGKDIVKTVRKDKKTKETQKIILINPKNNAHFKSIEEIKNFSWKLMSNKIKNPQYVIKIIKIGENQQAQRTFIAKTPNLEIHPKKVIKFKAQGPNVGNRISNINPVAVGQYKWRVTETSTGISSGYSFFSVSNCDINFTISNETIECLGYEGANRKFKICFNSTYSSTSGDLTFNNSGSGLFVYDQNGNILTFNLVSPNPTLVTQNGASTNTVSYCFEVTVPSSVTSIGFGLQGDDLDSSPIDCIPGVSQQFDKLPSCICNDCDRIQTKLTDINITPKDSLGNQYNISSNISVNVPIYGLEFQVQSYSYTSIPNSCSQGVNSIEQSGMILMPDTTVNGSTNLQLFNETISSSSTTNNHATKVVKYNSNTPLTGQIPINLTIGLPGPLAGLNASCCKMSYQVCIKVIIYYDKDSSKSCVITKCFNFNNQ